MATKFGGAAIAPEGTLFADSGALDKERVIYGWRSLTTQIAGLTRRHRPGADSAAGRPDQERFAGAFDPRLDGRRDFALQTVRMGMARQHDRNSENKTADTRQKRLTHVLKLPQPLLSAWAVGVHYGGSARAATLR